MIRKQIYLDERRQDIVRKMAETRGISEAEVIRNAIDVQAGRRPQWPPADPAAWKLALNRMRSLRVTSRKPGRSGKWTREEIYEDRLSRYARRSN